MIPKFRAWDKNGERWMTPTIEDIEESEVRLTLWGDVTFRLPWFAEVGDCSTTVVGNDMFEITQYTGLKDKNGQEIYEGDIVKLNGTYKDNKGKELGRYKVEWNDYYTGFYPLMDDHLRGNTEWEVIGNIYESPELLEDQNK